MSLVSLGGIGQAFASRNFKIFWWGQINLTIGAWVYRISIAWIVWEMTHSTAWLGIAAAAQMIPILVLCPFAGVCADRYGHLRQLICAIGATGLSGFSVGIFAAFDVLTIEWLIALCAMNGASRAFSIPSRQALLPALVEPSLLPAVIGFNSASYYGANFIGPAFGGALIAWFGAWTALIYFAVGAVIAVVSLPFLRLARRPIRTGASTSFIQDLVEGVRYTARHDGIRLMILMVAVLALFVQPTLEMLAGVAAQVLAMEKDGLALLAATFGCGAMSGGLWIAWRGRNQGLIRILLMGVAVALVALAVFSLSTRLWLSMPALFLIGFCVVIGSTAASSLIQHSVEPSLRARVMALDSMISTGAPALGAILIGSAGARFGIQGPLFAAALIGIVVLLVARPHVRRVTDRLESGLAQASSQPGR